jgi:hypothetical protein
MSNVYILGSGFSASCGLPTLNGLFPEILKFNRSGERDLENVHDALAFLYPHFNPENPGNYPPFEEFLSLLKISEDFGADSSYKPGAFASGYWQNIYNGCLRLLTDCIGFYANKAREESKDEAIRIFIENLRAGDVIITFNWDTLVEMGLLEKRVAFNLTERLNSGITVLKLHGSLSWKVLDEGINPSHPEHFFNLSNEDRIICLKDHNYLDTWDTLDQPPYIISPVSNKAPLHTAFLKKIWHEAFNSLIRANKIVVIGYSLPKEDFHARVLIRSSILEKAIHLIDPNPDIAGRFFSAVTPNIRYIQQFFSGNELKDILDR